MRLSENTDIREWWSSWNQDDDVDGTGETPDFRALAGLLTERTQAHTLHRSAVGVGVS